MEILDLGCGWGSLSLWLAERYPSARVLAVSNSSVAARVHPARARRGRTSRWSPPTPTSSTPTAASTASSRSRCSSTCGTARRCSARVAAWLEPGGKLFVHVFSHRELRLPLRRRRGWRGTSSPAGLMPSHDLLLEFQRDLAVERALAVDGTHYARTAEAWVEQFDAHADEILAILARVYGRRKAPAGAPAGAIFFMACAELWGYRGGGEWGVSHYLLSGRRAG